MSTAQKIIIDTDPGVDDAMAILYAMLSPEIDLVGLTSIFGNVFTDTATRNALALTELAEHPVPVAPGAQKPLVQEQQEPAWFVHGREGFGDVPPFSPRATEETVSAAEFICNMINRYPGEIVLCPIGPLTNIALALRHDPTIVDKVKSVTVMGASMEEGGNVTPYAEANIWQDPHAADEVFAASWDVTIVGLDVTHRIVCSPADFASLVEPAPVLGGFLNEAAQFYFDFHRKNDGLEGCHMHDPAAVISVIRPDLFEIDRKPVAVIVDGEQVGRTIVAENSDRPEASIFMKVDDAAVRNEFLKVIKSGF